MSSAKQYGLTIQIFIGLSCGDRKMQVARSGGSGEKILILSNEILLQENQKTSGYLVVVMAVIDARTQLREKSRKQRNR